MVTAIDACSKTTVGNDSITTCSTTNTHGTGNSVCDYDLADTICTYNMNDNLFIDQNILFA